MGKKRNKRKKNQGVYRTKLTHRHEKKTVFVMSLQPGDWTNQIPSLLNLNGHTCMPPNTHTNRAKWEKTGSKSRSWKEKYNE